jgi:hypothetical protein
VPYALPAVFLDISSAKAQLGQDHVGTGFGPMASVAYGGLQPPTAQGCGHEAGGMRPPWAATSPHAEE